MEQTKFREGKKKKISSRAAKDAEQWNATGVVTLLLLQVRLEESPLEPTKPSKGRTETG